jgi:hypothetical protein
MPGRNIMFLGENVVMASTHPASHGSSTGFFHNTAIIMALVIVAGFSAQFLMGRSTFSARPLVHVHGIAFMSWVALFVAQGWLATRGVDRGAGRARLCDHH